MRSHHRQVLIGVFSRAPPVQGAEPRHYVVIVHPVQQRADIAVSAILVQLGGVYDVLGTRDVPSPLARRARLLVDFKRAQDHARGDVLDRFGSTDVHVTVRRRSQGSDGGDLALDDLALHPVAMYR